jgi:hypothetical protein
MKPAKVLAPCEDKETLRHQYEAALSEDFTDYLWQFDSSRTPNADQTFDNQDYYGM